MAKIQNTFNMMAVFITVSSFIVFLLMIQVGWGLTISTAVALMFAAITAILATGTQYIQHQRHLAAFEQKQKVTNNVETHQSRTVEIDMPFEQAFDSALDALKLLDGEDIPKPLMFFRSKQILKIHREDAHMGRIEAGLRAKTIGVQDIIDFSRINIQLQRLDNETTRAQIDSRPNILGEVYDMGRHTHYVNQIALYLRQQSQQYTAENKLRDDFTTEQYNNDGIDDKNKKASDFRE